MTTNQPTQGNPARIARQQAIENALSAALFFIRASASPGNLQAATGRAMRATAMLQQACAEPTQLKGA